MKKISLLLLLLLSVIELIAQVHVRGYYRSNGTYVQPHYRSNPDGNPYNNWSYPGNTNPYTGKVATGDPDTYLRNYYNRNSTNRNNSSTYESPTYSSPSGSSTYSSPNTSSSFYNSLPSTSSFNDYDFEKMNKKLLEDAEKSNRELERSLRSYNYSSDLSSYDRYYNQLIAVQNAISYHDRYSYQDRMTLEESLNGLGYEIGRVDGIFDENTIRGVKEFQRQNRLKADGRLGSASVSKLGFRLK
ncbi:peptidoglycan-binding domain-containing protein [Spirosoma sp.]|uniref:peptidoglycan-binding domain-containing protein n=1 Tax=Spirosoma sp. TaxID=1899569 RepID=UPI003B3BA39F